MIRRMLTDPQLSGSVLNLLSTMTAEYRAPFDFSSPAEYQQYVRDSELRTLNLDLAKSFEELAIANFLSQQGIAFEYEKPYEFETATKGRRQYTPEFYLPYHDIYIEHFALDQRGRPPRGWTGYMEGVDWIRRQHAERRTSLIETYSWQHRDETLLDALERRLLEAGVEFDPVPVEELIQRISRERISWLAHLLGRVVKLSRHSCESRDPGASITKSFCNSKRFWIPAKAGMTEMEQFDAWQLNLTTRPRHIPEPHQIRQPEQ